jgi:hypothetical protein
MPWLSLIPWRAVGILAVLLGVFGYGYYGGVQHEREKQQVIAAKQIAAALTEERDRTKASSSVDTAHIAATEKIRTVTRTITKVIRDEKPSSACNLSNGWVLRHNEAAAGSVPDPASFDHANPSGITADIALEQVADNYGACNEVRQIALDCQGWIKEQQAVK